MKTSAAMENLWLYLQSLPRSNKQWLADRLIEDLQPHVEEDRVEYISKEEILAGIAEGLRDVKAGLNARPNDLANAIHHYAMISKS